VDNVKGEREKKNSRLGRESYQSSFNGFLERLRAVARKILHREMNKYQSPIIPHDRCMVSTWKDGRSSPPAKPQPVLNLFKIIDLAPFEPLLLAKYSSTRRRPPHPPVAILKALIFQRLRQIPSWRKLAATRRNDKRLLVELGFKKAPTRAAFSEFTLRVGADILDIIFRELVKQIRSLRPDFGEVLATDSTLVEAYANPNNGIATSDPDARWGYKEVYDGKPSYVYGYKLHMVCDAKYDAPVGYVITSGNRNDSPQYSTLIDHVAKLLTFKVSIADAGYDSKKNIILTLKHKAVPIINLNPRRGGKKRRASDYLLPISRNSKEWKEFYSMRASIERVFSRLKVELGLEHLKLRHMERVRVHVLLCLITVLLITLAAITSGHDELSRSIDPWRF